MAKVKKTRKQKMVADMRRIQSDSAVYKFAETPEKSPVIEKTSIEPKTSSLLGGHLISTADYDYLQHDLRKITIITTTIIIVQLLLKSLLNI